MPLEKRDINRTSSPNTQPSLPNPRTLYRPHFSENETTLDLQAVCADKMGGKEWI